MTILTHEQVERVAQIAAEDAWQDAILAQNKSWRNAAPSTQTWWRERVKVINAEMEKIRAEEAREQTISKTLQVIDEMLFVTPAK